MNIDAKRLYTLRTQRKLSREQLQQKSGVSARQISRFENEPQSADRVREATLTRLANALDVEKGVLTGELPMPDIPSEDGYLKARVNLLPSSQLAYELIEQHYGINRTTICNWGPLLFTLLAEGSLAWRRKKLDELHDAAEQLEHVGKSGHLHFASEKAQELFEQADLERDSLKEHDLFGKHLAPDAAPFADYLHEFASEFDKGVIEVRKLHVRYSDERFPRCRFFGDKVQQITVGSKKALLTLMQGHARLKDIPQELWDDDERRKQWLEEQYPTADVEELAFDM